MHWQNIILDELEVLTWHHKAKTEFKQYDLINKGLTHVNNKEIRYRTALTNIC